MLRRRVGCLVDGGLPGAGRIPERARRAMTGVAKAAAGDLGVAGALPIDLVCHRAPARGRAVA
ncbi:hypothetical protein EBZ70_11020 [bacterium]|nr:hypothetical protein [bacterium]